MTPSTTEQPMKSYNEDANLYSVLDVEKDATVDVIRAAYKKLAGLHHPDKDGGSTSVFKIIKNAYDILKDPARRQKYDLTGNADKIDVKEAARARYILVSMP